MSRKTEIIKKWFDPNRTPSEVDPLEDFKKQVVFPFLKREKSKLTDRELQTLCSLTGKKTLLNLKQILFEFKHNRDIIKVIKELNTCYFNLIKKVDIRKKNFTYC